MVKIWIEYLIHPGFFFFVHCEAKSVVQSDQTQTIISYQKAE